MQSSHCVVLSVAQPKYDSYGHQQPRKTNAKAFNKRKHTDVLTKRLLG